MYLLAWDVGFRATRRLKDGVIARRHTHGWSVRSLELMRWSEEQERNGFCHHDVERDVHHCFCAYIKVYLCDEQLQLVFANMFLFSFNHFLWREYFVNQCKLCLNYHPFGKMLKQIRSFLAIIIGVKFQSIDSICPLQYLSCQGEVFVCTPNTNARCSLQKQN